MDGTGKPHTHYDNLKVARNAPPEVIKAAYKVLAQKYHPDRWQGTGDSTAVMSAINASYGVLMDAGQRAQHDAWIRSEEARHAQASPHPAPAAAPEPEPAPQPQPVPASESNQDSDMSGQVFSMAKALMLWGLLALAAYAWLSSGSGVHGALASMQELARSLERMVPDTLFGRAAQRPGVELDPLGRRWPSDSGDIPGMPWHRAGGLSRITLDNAGNDAPFYVRLVAVDVSPPLTVRHVFVARNGSAFIGQIAAGTYIVEYLDLVSHQPVRAEPPIVLREVPYRGGIGYGTATVALARAGQPGRAVRPIALAEFLR